MLKSPRPTIIATISFSALCLLCSPILSAAQADHASASRPAPGGRDAAAPDPYLDQAIATVETRKITRREIARLYLDYNPGALTANGAAGGPQHTQSASADISKLAPHIFGTKPGQARQPAPKATWDKPATTAELHRLATRLFTTRPRGFDDAVSQQMQLVALQVAAERRGVPVSPSEAAAGVHGVLDRIRVSQELPLVPGRSDHDLARRLGTSYNLHYRTVLTRLLTRNLILSDLNDRLGHAPQADDFYRAHVILLTPELKHPASPEGDWERARQKAEALRADILAKRKTFEEIAEQMSDDPSSKHGGDTGPLVRTLLPHDLEQAVLQLQPGEITPPIRTRQSYLLVRLDKRGSDLTEAERQSALAFCCGSRTRERNALARVLKDITWSSAVAEPPEWFRKAATN